MSRPTKILLSILAVFSASSVAAGPFQFPDTRPGQIAAAFFAAYHEGPDAIRGFTEDWRSRESLGRRSTDERVAQYEQFRAMLGVLEPHSAIENESSRLVVLAHATTPDAWFQVSFEVESTVPYKLSSMAIMPGPAPAGSELVTEWTDLEDFVRQTRGEAGIPALAVAIVTSSGIESAVAGVREVDTEDAVRDGDRFHLGSVTKSMTATLVALLIQDGLLHWDTTLTEALPKIEMRDEYRDVTIEQLLRHRGGLPGYLTFSDEEEARLAALPGDAVEQRAAFLGEVLQSEPVNEPGKAMHYSNAGYVALGHIAEKITNTPWEQLIRVRLFEQLEMTSAETGWPATPDRPGQPRGHSGTPPDLEVQALGALDLGTYLAPAGDVCCSVEDLARYAEFHLQALREGTETLGRETAKRLCDPGPAADGGGYAGGWIVDDDESGRRWHHHAGSAGTFYAMVRLIPEENTAAVVLMNSGSLANASVAEEIADRLLEGRSP